jgi:hypothetical protein
MSLKNILFITVYLLTSLIIQGQSKTFDTLTAAHVNIEGTKISVIPPIGFTKGVNFSGLQQTQSGASIMVLDIPGPFNETSKAITKEGFLSQGIEIKEIENLTISNLPAIFATGIQVANGSTYIKYVLCFGTDKETIMINGAVPNSLKEIATEVKASILSSVYEPNKKINPFDNIDYTIDLTDSKLQFAKSISNSLIFTTDGAIPTKSANKTSLIIAKSFSNKKIEDKKSFCLNRIKQLPIELVATESVSELTIDGISGFQIIALSTDKKTKEKQKVCQVILFSDDLYYILYGSTNNDFEANLKEIKKVILTFKRK